MTASKSALGGSWALIFSSKVLSEPFSSCESAERDTIAASPRTKAPLLAAPYSPDVTPSSSVSSHARSQSKSPAASS